jgi:hypothetical protein
MMSPWQNHLLAIECINGVLQEARIHKEESHPRFLLPCRATGKQNDKVRAMNHRI